MTAGLVQIQSATQTIAQKWGCRTQQFFDDFTSLSTIDLTNSVAPGFNWYLQIPATYFEFTRDYGPANPAWFSQSGSVMSETNDNTTNEGVLGLTLTTAGYIVGSTVEPRTVGPALISGAKPFYLEGRTRFTLPNSLNLYCPALWLCPRDVLIYGVDQISAHPTLAEIDLYQCFPALKSGIIAHTTGSAQTEDQQAITQSWDNTSFHNWSILVVPIAYNDGVTGFCRWYLDGVQNRPDATWTAGSLYSCVENTNFEICMSSGPTPGLLAPHEIDYIGAWVHP